MKQTRFSRHVRAVLLVSLLTVTMTGCACRPGYVGPYGGVHPTRCWAW